MRGVDGDSVLDAFHEQALLPRALRQPFDRGEDRRMIRDDQVGVHLDCFVQYGFGEVVCNEHG